MKMKNDIAVLEIFLYEQKIGTLTHLPGDRNLFSFNQDYINDNSRPTLSLSFKDEFGSLLTNVKSTRRRIPPFFANLLPEGYLRDFLARRANLNSEKEFELIAALGNDLPGAIRMGPMIHTSSEILKPVVQEEHLEEQDGALHFSLAGVQLKFSGIWDNESGITIPMHGVGGAWIIKLPSPSFVGVPQNEYAMMEMARKIGIDVPKTALMPLEHIKGLPKEMERLDSYAFVIQRFDRNEKGQRIHIEDFAQVFAVYPEKKYRAASYRNIAEVIWSEIGPQGLVEFLRRFVFNALIGNGDMHLKNWSLIYPEQRTPQLAPAYDYVSTLPYLPDDLLALNFLHSKKFNLLTLEQFKRFAAQSQFPEKLVIDTVLETVNLFAKVFESVSSLLLEDKIHEIISRHLESIPIWTLR